MMKLTSWSWIMVNLIKKKNWGKRKEIAFRRGTWLIHYMKVMYIKTVFKNYVSSKNI